MKRKEALLFLIFCFLTVPAGATYNRLTRWEGENAAVSIYGNYGHPLGEEIRLRNHKRKALNIFNALESAKINTSIAFALHPLPPSFNADKVFNELSPETVEKELKTSFNTREKFNPVYDRGVLFYQKWKGGKMRVEFEGNPATPWKDTAFCFAGKIDDNMLISVAGKVKYIDEVDWIPVQSLKEYTADEIRFLDNSSLIARVEEDMTGRRYIAVSRFRTDEEPLMIVPDPGMKSAAANIESGKIVALKEHRGAHSIMEYDFQKKRWSEKYTSADTLYLAGLNGDEFMWWNAETETFHFSSGGEISGLGHKAVSLYPRGRFTWGEEEDEFSALPEKIIVLMYSAQQASLFEEKGFSDINKLGVHPRIWLLNKRYKSSFDELPDDLGHVYLSPENSKIYYNKSGGGLRTISSVSLRPAIPAKYLLTALVAILIMLVLYDIFKKTKEVSS